MSESNLPPPLPKPVYHAAARAMRAALSTYISPAFISLATELAEGFETAAGTRDPNAPTIGIFWARPQPTADDYNQAASLLDSLPTIGRQAQVCAMASSIANMRAEALTRADHLLP